MREVVMSGGEWEMDGERRGNQMRTIKDGDTGSYKATGESFTVVNIVWIHIPTSLAATSSSVVPACAQKKTMWSKTVVQ
jgi:hypothetical protein